MKTTLLQENLKKALSIGNKFVSAKAQLPVLSHVLIEVNDSAFIIQATNLETGVQYRIGAKIEETGSITVPAKVVSEFVDSLPAGQVLLESKDQVLRIEAGNYTASFQGIQAEEFPTFPTKAGAANSQLDIKKLSKLVEKVGFAASTDISRPVLTGILWELGDEPRLVATDGYRLSVVDLATDILDYDGEQMSLLAPSGVLRDAVKVFMDTGNTQVSVQWSEKQRQLFFEAEDMAIVTRLLEGEFPNYRAIIPESGSVTVTLDRRETLHAVKAAAVFARESANIIKWQFDGTGLIISANSPQVGKNKTEVAVNYINKAEGTIAFNNRYLTDILSHLESDQIRFLMNEPLQPGLFMEGETDSFKHVIMPVRVND